MTAFTVHWDNVVTLRHALKHYPTCTHPPHHDITEITPLTLSPCSYPLKLVDENNCGIKAFHMCGVYLIKLLASQSSGVFFFIITQSQGSFNSTFTN